MRLFLILTVLSTTILISQSCKKESTNNQTHHAEENTAIKENKNSVSDQVINFDQVAINDDNTINAYIEIPVGTHAKYEVDKEDMKIKHSQVDGVPRNINYLAYPANYGMIPSSILPLDKGGDGDPLDIIILGERIERGQLTKCHLVGMLSLLDNGEQDDKLIAVPMSGTFSDIRNIKELNKTYPGVITIIETWFSNYKGANEMESLGIKDQQEAMDVLKYAVKSYTNN
jgi:inorganic pyrophosphatase